jgi:hypothetical protein
MVDLKDQPPVGNCNENRIHETTNIFCVLLRDRHILRPYIHFLREKRWNELRAEMLPPSGFCGTTSRVRNDQEDKILQMSSVGASRQGVRRIRPSLTADLPNHGHWTESVTKRNLEQ